MNKIKQIRHTMNMNQREFAGYLGISQITLSKIEHDEPVFKSIIERVCSKLNIDTEGFVITERRLR